MLPLLVPTLLLTLPQSSRADGAPYLFEHHAYTVALESGDTAAAVMHARAAWTAAEEALGDHRLTGVFAYNYGRLILFDDPEAALKALRRAARLHNASLVELPVPRIRLYLRYAEFAASGYGASEADELRELLETFNSGDAVLASDVAAMWHQLAMGHFAEKRFGDAIDSAARAEAALMQAPADDPHRLAGVILIGGISRLVRKDGIYVALEVREDFRRARLLFPPQKNLETFDPLFAKVLAWNEAVETLLSILRCGRVYGNCVEEEDPKVRPLFQYPDAVACEEIEWLENQTPHFPRLFSGAYGAVLVGYRLGDDLRVHDARILAQEPFLWRGDIVLETLSGWRAKELPSDPACYQNLAVMFRVATPRPGARSRGQVPP